LRYYHGWITGLSAHRTVKTGEVLMVTNGVLQILFFLAVLLALVKPLGWYMARVYEGKSSGLDRVAGPVERLLYRLYGVDMQDEMGWKRYAISVLALNCAGFVFLYLLQRLQGILPVNPEHLAAVKPDTAFNTAVSFITNTNWQSYSGETTMSYLTQMLGMTVQNFVSAATGMAAMVAMIRGFTRHSCDTLGNFWVDMTRSVLYILLPLSILWAVALMSQGVVQSFDSYPTATLVEPVKDADGKMITEQTLAIGPAASQIAIKQLGTNGGGFFNANSSHPFENPTPLSNFLELLAILLIPAALCYTFGKMVGDVRQGWTILAAMTVVFCGFLLLCIYCEQQAPPWLAKLGVDTQAGNMEGKEVRFGIANSALWTTATTCASNGSVNAMHDSYTPLGGLVPILLIQLGEIIFGGVGSGLYGMLLFAIKAVFIAGLMVGRTPEYLGKKIEAFEVKMAAMGILIPIMAVLIGTAIAIMVGAGRSSVANPGAHGFSEVLYAFSSAAGNNGSAFAGLSADTPFYNLSLGIVMLVGRYWILIPALAIGGSLARKKATPVSAGTLPTHGPLFVGLLVSVILIIGALSFIPALALGPIVEHLIMFQ
jgi:K+-transporting ATPase ATPase A chain